MCLAHPVKVVEVNKDEAIVNAGGLYKKVMVIDPVKVGDLVMIQNGVIVEIIDES